jgi:hypothetical protein
MLVFSMQKLYSKVEACITSDCQVMLYLERMADGPCRNLGPAD